MRLGRLVIAVGLAFATVAYGQDTDPSLRWPRAVIVVFERRIPTELDQGHAGERLRDLRSEVVRELDEQVHLRVGDHVFVFADGISTVDFNCSVWGAPDCNIASAGGELEWKQESKAARALLGRMLRLPDRASRTVTKPVVARDGSEFLHFVYNGDFQEIDCAIRRFVTGPLTEEVSQGTDTCPTEGSRINQAQTRAISRVEISLPVQVTLALSEVSKPPVSQVLWIWALLREKNFNRQDSMQGIRLDFGNRSQSLVDFYERASQQYIVVPWYTKHLNGGPFTAAYRIQWRPSEEAAKSLEESGQLTTQVGRLHAERLTQDLRVERSYLGGSWQPAIDAFELSLQLSDRFPARIVDASVKITTDSQTWILPSLAGSSNTWKFANRELDAAYREALQHPPPSGRAFRTEFDILVNADEASGNDGLTPIPSVHKMPSRVVQITPRAATTRELGLMGGFVVLSFVVVGATWLVLRPLPFDLNVNPEILRCSLPVERQQTKHLDVVAHSDHFHRRWFRARTGIVIKWEFLAPPGLPLRKDRFPVSISIGGTALAIGTDRESHISWKPGTRSRPTLLQSMQLVVHPESLDSSLIAQPMEFNCVIKLEVNATPKALLRLLPSKSVFYVPMQLRIEEERPSPDVTFQIDSIYRRLGWDSDRRSSFASLVVSNIPHSGGVARSVEFEAILHIEDSGQQKIKLSFDDGAQEIIKSSVGNGETKSWRVSLQSDGGPTEAVQEVRGSVAIMMRDSITAASETRVLTWNIPFLSTKCRLLGLDLGTSGTRLLIEKGENTYQDETVKFPMGVVNQGDNAILDEFPVLTLINDEGRVVRVGSGPYGILAEASDRLRFVESPKAALLAATFGPRKKLALQDLDSYVAAIGRVWKSLRGSLGVQHAKIVVTVPWSYSREVVQSYCSMIRRSFEGVVLVVPVHEAEAAAYFHLLRHDFTFEGNASRFPRNREFRTLVVDLGAGTTDCAVVATTAPQGRVEELVTLAHTSSEAAGNRYDEVLLQEMFGIPEAAKHLAQDRRLRDEVRIFKEQVLEEMLRTGVAHRNPLLGQPRTSSMPEFLAMMEPFFQEAITRPLEEVARQLEDKRHSLDEVLLAGRGIFAIGCRERTEIDVRRLFTSAPGVTAITIRPFGRNEMPWGIARGAITFGRSGDVQVGDSDLAVSRDLVLIADVGGAMHRRSLRRIGEVGSRTAPLSFDFGEDVLGAWILAGKPSVSEQVAREAFGHLVTGETPVAVTVVATWHRRAAARALTIQLGSDEIASFKY